MISPLRRATAVLACPHCRGNLRPEARSLVCRRGHRFDVARRGSVRLDAVLKPDGRLLVLTPAAGHLHELLAHAPIGIDVHKRERLDRQLGQRFELERRLCVTDRVQLSAVAGAALYRMGPWARHAIAPRPLRTVTVAVELGVYRPRRQSSISAASLCTSGSEARIATAQTPQVAW